MLDETAYLYLLDDDEPVERRALPSGFDPWGPTRFSVSQQRRAIYLDEIARLGVDVQCSLPGCTNVRRVHPVNLPRALWCSTRCRDIATRWRRERRMELPTRPIAWKPWERRKR